ASEIDPGDLALAPRPEWRRLSWTGPILVGTRMPEDAEQRRLVIEEFMSGGAGIERSPKYYQDFGTIAPVIFASASSRGDIAGAPNGLTHPIVSRRGEGMLLIEPKTAMPIKVAQR